MPGPAVRCPSCGHALFTVDEPAWLARAAEPPPAGPLLLRVAEAAEMLAISRSTLYQLVAAGRVPVVRLGRAVRVPRRELERSTVSARTTIAAPAAGSRSRNGASRRITSWRRPARSATSPPTAPSAIAAGEPGVRMRQ